MDVAWGEDYDVLAEVAKSVFTRFSPLTDRHKDIDFQAQHTQFRNLDWLDLGDATGLSTEGAALGSIAAIFVEMGYALVDGPLLELMMARDAAMVVGSADAMDLASAIGSGELSVATNLASGGWGPALTFNNGILSGTALAISYADRVDSFLFEAVDGNERVLMSVQAGAGVQLVPMPNLGDYPMFAVTITAEAEVREMARGDSAETAVETAKNRAAVLRAAQVHGAGRRLLETTVQYATERHQFGGPIGRFQAVQYLCTDIAIDVHLTSLYVRSAANAIDLRSDAQPHVALMSKHTVKTAREMVHAAHEVHAGIGYMVESNVHLFTKAAKRWQYDFGKEADLDSAVTAAVDHLYEGASA